MMCAFRIYDNEQNCCGCGACIDACPQKAISLKDNEFGFRYPYINNSLCISCGVCKASCGFQNKPELRKPEVVYAGFSRNDMTLSSSGGLFACIARRIIEEGGVVYGCSMEKVNGKLIPKHICVDKIADLPRLQGSKYVQSETENIYSAIKHELSSGRKVLFSGTPCQNASLIKFIGKQSSNLLTLDFICHGVPSYTFFREYIELLEKSMNATIDKFVFRGNIPGNSFCANIEVVKKNGKKKQIYLPSYLSSYYSYFLSSEIYRDSCYKCELAQQFRVSDITLGDFWGIEDTHPEFCMKNNLEQGAGVSCILINTNKGKECFEKIKSVLIQQKSTLDKVVMSNKQLNSPSIPSKTRSKLLALYKDKGYKAIEEYYKKNLGIKLMIRKLRFVTQTRNLK